MNTDRYSKAEQIELITDPIERARREAENGVRQFEMMLATIRDHVSPSQKPFQLRSHTILELQDAALRGIDRFSGTFRNTPVSIVGSKHAPPAPFLVADEVHSLCNYVSENWDQADALHLGAYILWKLNWIHPFSDANGRTARAVSYLVMSIKFDTLLPGTPTIPEQIASDKAPYYDALETADSAWLASARVDVSELEKMLEAMLVHQLLGLAAIPTNVQQQFQRMLDLRVRRAPPDILHKYFGSGSIKDQLWAIGDHLVLQIAPEEEIEKAEKRQKELGSSFPNLLATGDSTGLTIIPAGEPRAVITNEEISVGVNHAFGLERDAALGLRNITLLGEVNGSEVKWSSVGALYIVRLGQRISDQTFHKFFDVLIARDLSREP